MKRRILIIFCLILVVFGLPAAETGWEWDAEKADSLFYSGDYDAAWLFYERAMVAGVDDAKILFRAAESFDRQQLIENPEFGKALHTVSHSLMQTQYPGDAVLSLSEVAVDRDAVVNRQYIRRTYGMIGAKAPKARRDLSTGFGSKAIRFCSLKIEDLGTFFTVLVTEGPRDALEWTGGRLWNLLFGYLMISLIPGIILPVVMAVTVAREGRKSYVTAYSFLIFWGPLGIHRFYMGRHISGIIWLLTGGLAGIGLFFDLFLSGAYIRFWNEDHKSDRLSTTGSVSGSGVSRRVKTPKTPKAPKRKSVKPTKVKAQKAPKKKKEKKVEKIDRLENTATGIGAGAAAAASVLDEDEFSFDSPSDGGDDFGELPDLDLGDDDFNITAVDEGLGDLTDLAGGNKDDDFDLGSLD